jgi:anti-anti-sigma factor
MEVTGKALKRVYYVTVSGRVDAETAPQLDAVLDEAMAQGYFRFVLDLKDVTFISSRGLRSLLRLRKTVRRFNRGDVRLVNVPPNIQETLSLTGLLSLFPTYDDVVEAVGSF